MLFYLLRPFFSFFVRFSLLRVYVCVCVRELVADVDADADADAIRKHRNHSRNEVKCKEWNMQVALAVLLKNPFFVRYIMCLMVPSHLGNSAK